MRSHQRPLVDGFVQVVNAPHLDRRFFAVGAEAPEHFGLRGKRLLQPTGDFVTLGHDVPRQRRCRRGLLQHRDLVSGDQPGFVAQDKETICVQQVDGLHPRIVSSRDDHDIPRPLGAQPLQIVGAAIYAELPLCRVMGALVEGLHNLQEALHLGTVFSVDVDDDVAQPGMALAQGKRRMEVAGIENYKSVRVDSQ